MIAFQLHLVRLFPSFIILSLFRWVDSCHPNDHSSLLRFSDPLHKIVFPPLNWSKAVDCCQWEGISCDKDGRVSHLWLPSRRLGGYISPSIANLTHLSHLNLSNNFLNVPIYGDDRSILPEDIFASLGHLEVLDISNNQLYGRFPSLSKSMSIRILDISHNRLHGRIHVPYQFVAPNLTIFRVDSNYFDGKIPDSLFFNCSLHVLNLSYNNFIGMIPQNITKCSYLKELDISGNHLSGSIPEEIGKLVYLEQLYLSENHLVGSIPLSLMNSTHLSMLNLRFNNISGYLSHLNFSGLSSLRELDLGYNFFRGEFPHSMLQCKSLEVLDLSENHLLGQNNSNQVQSTMFYESNTLRFLFLRGCGFSQIPAWLTKLKSLQVINLSYNQITDSIPSWVGTLPNLWAIYLSYNQIFGCIPPELFNLPALKVANDKGSLHMLNILDLSHNHLSGRIPYELVLPNLECLDVSYNYLSGRIPYELVLPKLEWLDVSHNHLSGSIPYELVLPNLYWLNVSHNHLSGSIPYGLGFLPNLEWLDVSHNHLLGSIPYKLVCRPNLEWLDVSYNNLHGPIPHNQFCPFHASSSYEGNPDLCGSPLPWNCPNVVEGEHKQTTQAENNGKDLWFHIGAAFGFMTGFYAICYSFFFSITWRRAFFRFLIHLYNQVYVFVAIRVNRFRNK